MYKVLVVGAGPAGLGAAERLLAEGRGQVAVEMVTMEPYLGGAASSFTTKDGRVVEQGQHIMAGFYHEMRDMLTRCGVDVDATTTSNEGRVIIWEDRDQKAHYLHLGGSSLGSLVDGLSYDGMTFKEKIGFARCFAEGVSSIAAGIPDSLDDVCATAWCLEKGLSPSFAMTNAFRMSREAQFNWPGEISAHSLLSALKLLGRDFRTSEIRFPRGSMSDIWWGPVGRHLESQGVPIHRGWKLTGLRHQGGHLRGLDFARLAPEEGIEDFVDRPRMSGETRAWTDFDAAIVTICPGSMQEILKSDPALAALPGFRGIPRIQTVSPMGLHVWHRNAVTRGPRTIIGGLRPPFAIAVDNKPFNPLYSSNPRFGAVLHFVGQETGFEDCDDNSLLDQSLASIRRLPGYEGMDREGVLAWRLVRDTAPHRRYWNTEPGSLRYKPPRRTIIPELWLAGDWVRSDEDFPCMECALRCGRTTAHELLQALPTMVARKDASPSDRIAGRLP